NRNRSTSHPFYFSSRRTRDIGVVVIHIGIVYYRRLVIDFIDVFPGDIVVVNVSAHNSSFWDKHPIVTWNVDGDLDTQTRHQGRPAVVIATGPPVDPCGSPFVTRNPCPSQIIIKIPSSIVKRCPSPIIIGHPSIAVGGHYPIAVAGVRRSEERR